MKFRRIIYIVAVLSMPATSHAAPFVFDGRDEFAASERPFAGMATLRPCQFAIPPEAELRDTFDKTMSNQEPDTSGTRREIFRKDSSGEFRNDKGETILENLQNNPPQ